jgi:hypothetical protein
MGKIRDKQPDADAGRVMVDEQLEDLEARLTAIYTDVAKEMQKDMDSFMVRYKAEDEKKKEQVENGELSQEAYESWKERQIFRSDAMQAKIDDLTSRAVNADKQAMAMVNDQLPETYATSYNFGGYKGEVLANAAGYDYTGFTIINQDAVKTLMKDNPDLIPWKPDVDVPEDKKWNRQKVQEAVLQGIVKGDSMDDVAKRLLPIVNMDKNAAIRTARTAVNGIENKGRKDATERVKEAGVPMVERWTCTHDDRTRDTHILLDGTEPNKDGKYGEGILTTLLAYPGDPAGDPEEVYNCRCGTTSTIEGIDHSKDQDLYAQFMEQNYYEDWVNVKESIEGKESAFQAKKEGAAERIAERKEKQADKEEKQDANQSANNILGNAYENHRINNELRSVPLEEMQDSPFSSVSASYDHISDETASKINDTLGKLTSEYDTPLCKISTMDASQALGNTAFATTRHNYSVDTAEIILNPMKMNDYEKMTERIMELVEKGYCPQIPPESAGEYIITHEFGHTILNMRDTLSDSQNWVGADFETIRIARSEINEIYEEYISAIGQLESEKKSLEFEVIMGTADEQTVEKAKEAAQALSEAKISNYSLTNVDEFLAESFANEKLGYNSNPYSERVVAVLDKYFGR